MLNDKVIRICDWLDHRHPIRMGNLRFNFHGWSYGVKLLHIVDEPGPVSVGIAYLNVAKYSKTTSAHQNLIRQALEHKGYFIREVNGEP